MDPAKPPEAVHAALWARVGTEFVLELGFVDLQEMHHSVKTGTAETTVPLYITHRFSLSPEAVIQVSEQLGLMGEELSKIKDRLTALDE